MAGVIQNLDLNFDLYVLILFNGACSTDIEFVLSKKDFIDRFASYWSNWRASDQSLLFKDKVCLNKF